MELSVGVGPPGDEEVVVVVLVGWGAVGELELRVGVGPPGDEEVVSRLPVGASTGTTGTAVVPSGAVVVDGDELPEPPPDGGFSAVGSRG
jgi:hypothetical protein